MGWLIAIGVVWAGDGMDRLLDTYDWVPVAEVAPDGDVIRVQKKLVDGLTCVRGVVVVEVPPAALLDVVSDIPANPSWSSERLLVSALLTPAGDDMAYWQYLDVPDWTLVSDRFWVVRGRASRQGAGATYTFERLEGWPTAYPALAKQIAGQYPGAVEPDPLFGAWVFTPQGSGTDARYHLCSNAGASLPQWVQTAAATRTVPGTVADVLREARRRVAALRGP